MAVLQSQHKVSATIAYISNGKPSKFGDGDYYSVCFEAPELPEKTIWKNLKLDEVALLHKGMQVTLTATARNGRNTWDVILPENTFGKLNPKPESPKPEAVQPTLSNDKKREIAQYISDMGDLYSYCYQVAQNKLGEAPEAAQQAMASSLFIATQRRFSLA